MTIAESRKSPKRSQNEVRNYFRQFAVELNHSLKQHGDRRLEQSAEIAVEFAQQTLRRVESFDMSSGDFIDQILTRAKIPLELTTPQTTVEEIGELAVYAKQLEQLGELLNPPARLSMVQMKIDALPSYVLERRLRSHQLRANRVSGSDVGDGQLAVLVFYADYVQVDKRTYHYLEDIKRREPGLGRLMQCFVKEGSYTKVLDLIQ